MPTLKLTSKRQNESDTSWIGSLARYAKGKRHDLKTIRASIGKALGRKASRDRPAFRRTRRSTRDH